MSDMREINIRRLVWVAAFVFGLLLSARSLEAAEHPWRLRIDKDGVQAYTRQVDESSILEFKANIIVDVPLSDVVSVFEDVTRMTGWFYQCTLAELVQKEDDINKVVYMTLRLPWPVTARDCVCRISKAVDSKTGALDYMVTALPDRRPLERTKIRVPYLKGVWRFVPLADGRTEIHFQQHSDPGGLIPTFISNSLVVDMPYHSLRRLRALIVGGKK